MDTQGNQRELRLAWGALKSDPQDAPAKVLRQVESEHQALHVSILAGSHKAAYIAAAVGKSEGYISKLRKGERPIPEHLIGPLCNATGSNLLRQYRELQRAIEGVSEDERLAALLRQAA